MRRSSDINTEYTQIKSSIINAYENILKKFWNIDSQIQKMERGVIMPNWQEYYEDYFQSTHREIKEKLRKNNKDTASPLLMVIRISAQDKKEIIFSTEVKDNTSTKEIIYIDDILDQTPKNMRHLFYNEIGKLKAEEKIFWQRKNLEKIKKITQDEVLGEIKL